jgi:uncharacterized metal-binding protein YceD (DUF177 family)
MPEPTRTRETDGLSLPLKVSDLPHAGEVAFRVTPSAEARARLAADLDLRKLRKLDFAGRLLPEGRHDWKLVGQLGATAVQDCVVTGEPVTTRVDTQVQRVFLRRMPEPEAEEIEIPEDDRIEPMGAVIDPGAVMAEALSLALPDYPRAPGAAFDDDAQAAPEGAEPLRRNPFEALKTLMDNDPDKTGGGS